MGESCAATVRSWRTRNPDKVREYNRRANLKRSGWTCEEYAEALAAQGGVCAICQQPETMVKNGQVQPLAADHDHDTFKPRGLLCVRCNSAIGLMSDDVERLAAAIAYLNHYEMEDA